MATTVHGGAPKEEEAAVLTPDEAAQIPSGSLPLGLQVSHLVAEFTRLTVRLFALVSSTTTTASSSLPFATTNATESVLAALSDVDRKLAGLVVLYEAHRRRQARIDSLIRHLGTLDAHWRDSASTLARCVRDLAPVVASGRADRAAISTAREAHLDPAAVLAYARLLAPFTSAPPASLFPPEVKLKGVGATDPTGRTLPASAIPPFPTEATMRGGRLQFGREGLLQGYLGETEPVGAGRRDSITGTLLPPEHDPHGAAGRNVTASSGLETEARLQAAAAAAAGSGRGGGPMHEADAGGGGDEAGGGADDFVFDLDLNPDL